MNLRLMPIRTKYIASVTTIAGTRSTTMRSPLIAPNAAPTSSTIGTASIPPRPFGTSTMTKTAEQKVISGEIVRSKPPRPLMIDGVLAIAAIASGANVANCCTQPKFGCTMRLAMSRSVARSAAIA
jgi:hypothetical protein